MRHLARLLGVLALLLGADTAHATDFRSKDSPYTYADERRIRELITFVEQHSSYHSPGYLPTFRYHSLKEINQTVQGDEYRGTITAYAYFLRGSDLITLFEGFAFKRDDDVMVHEIVHWLQEINGAEFPCKERREAEAFRIQLAFIEQTGIQSPIPKVDIQEQTSLICVWEYATFESKIYRTFFSGR